MEISGDSPFKRAGVLVDGGQYDLHGAYSQLRAEDTAPVAGDPWLHVDCNIITPRHLADRYLPTYLSNDVVADLDPNYNHRPFKLNPDLCLQLLNLCQLLASFLTYDMFCYWSFLE